MVATIVILLGLVVISSQFAVIVQCGKIHRRIGPRALDDWAEGSAMFRALIGTTTVLERNSRFIFGSLTCSHCLNIIRGISDKEGRVQILLADAKDDAEVNFFRKRFPEITRELLPGKESFESLNVNHLPFFVETDNEHVIRKAERLTQLDELQNLLK